MSTQDIAARRRMRLGMAVTMYSAAAKRSATFTAGTMGTARRQLDGTYRVRVTGDGGEDYEATVGLAALYLGGFIPTPPPGKSIV